MELGSSKVWGSLQISLDLIAKRLISTVNEGTSPLVVNSSTVVTKLNSDLVDGLHVAVGRNNLANQIVRTDGNGYIQAGYINSSSGNENNAFSPPRIWGTNGVDDYLRTYQTSQLSVKNADTIDSKHLTDITVTAGNGLVDGGALSAAAAVTLNMGTPTTLTSTTSNAVTNDSHTHAITNFNLSGTANQITVTGAGKVLGEAITLSLPQDIHITAQPIFKGLSVIDKVATGNTPSPILSIMGYVNSVWQHSTELSSNSTGMTIDISATSGGPASFIFTKYGGLSNYSTTDTDGAIYWNKSIKTTNQLVSTVATGTAPLVITSTTKVNNLNVDLLDDMTATSAATGSTIVSRDASGNFSAGTITATLSGNATTSSNCTGNAGTATVLQNSRSIQTNLASTASASFNGSANITPGVTGTLPVANGGTGTTTSTGTGSVVLSASPTFTGTISAASMTLSGNLTVNGSTITINSTTMSVSDKNIELGAVATPTDTTAEGGGFTLRGTTDKTITWGAINGWSSSETINLVSGKVYKINGNNVLSATGLGSGVTSSSLTSVGVITSGTWSGSFGAVSGANLTSLTAGNLAGTIPSGVLANSTLYVGTTAITLNRGSNNLALTGISSIALPGSTSGTITITPLAVAGTTAITIPATSGTLITTGDTGTVSNAMLGGSIANAKLVNSKVTVGTTDIALGGSSTTLVGLSSVTSTTFVGALTGNASTATTASNVSNGAGIPAAAGERYISISSTDGWAYLRLMKSSTIVWDIGQCNGGNLEFRPAGGDGNRMTYSSTGILNVAAQIAINGTRKDSNWDAAYSHSVATTGAEHGAATSATASTIARRDTAGGLTSAYYVTGSYQIINNTTENSLDFVLL